MNILVIEDNPSHLKLAHHVLSAAGHDVSALDAAKEAAAMIRADRPEVILLDMELPGMDGLALIRQLKSDPETAGIQIVAVTAYTDRFPKSVVMEAGCAGYIAKPINTRTLSGQLQQCLG